MTLLLLALFSTALSACRAPMGGDALTGGVVLESYRMSPDGETVLFQYSDTRAISPPNVKAGAKLHGLGLLEWRTGRLTRVPVPAGKELTAPSWSYDGKRFVASMANAGSMTSYQIVEVDVSTFAVTKRVGEDYVKGVSALPPTRTNPVYQPETGNILYVVWSYGAIPRHFRLFNPSDGSDTIILAEQDGFWTRLYVPAFIGPDEIAFTAAGGVNPEMAKVVKDLTRWPVSVVAYRLKFGGKPEVLFPHLQKNLKIDDPVINGVTATPDGKIMVASRYSHIEPKNSRGQYNYDINRIDGGVPRPLTDLRTYLTSPDIAYGGSAIAFGIDPERSRKLDLAILDMKTGAVTRTGLLARIERQPEFSLRP